MGKVTNTDQRAHVRADAARYVWVDYAKGICIIGVVTLYSADLIKYEFGVKGWMQYWVDFARPFRMPDFFILSGLFLSRSIDKPWREYLDKKVFHYLYFFILWTIIIYVSIRLMAQWGLTPETLGRKSDNILSWLWEPYGMLWFIHLLPILFIFTRLIKNFPVRLIMFIAILLQTFPIKGVWGPLEYFCERFVFFYIGYIFSEHIFSLAKWTTANRRAAFFTLLGWMIVNEFFVLIGRSGSKGVSIFLGVTGTCAVIVMGTLLSKYPASNWLRYLGQHSIVSYLGFYIPLVFMVAMLHAFDQLPDIGTVCAVISAVSIFIAHLIFRCTRGTLLSFLFERPRWTSMSRDESITKSGPC